MPVQTPLWQLSPVVQVLLSSHDVPSGAPRSIGQAADVPLQLSATSQTPAELRQTVPFDFKVSAGQVLLEPSQLSATSHPPAALRQTDVLFWSLGQLAPDPVQLSATSHVPADERQTVVADLNVSAGHAALTPLQFLGHHAQGPKQGDT